MSRIFGMLVDKQRLRHNLRNGLIRHLAVDIEVLLMKNTDDLIDGIPVDQQAGKAGLCKGSGNFLMALVDVHGFQLDPVGQNSAAVRSPNSRAFRRSAPLVLVNAAVVPTSSIKRSNSSWDILALPSVLMKREMNFFALGKEEIQGRQHPDPQADETWRLGVPLRCLNMAKRVAPTSGRPTDLRCFQLGVISPKSRTTRVTTTVEIVAPMSP